MLNMIKHLRLFRLLAVAGGIALAAQPALAAKISEQRSFASPDEAVAALVDSARKGDRAMTRAILGPTSRKLESGDEARAKRERESFLAAYDAKHALVDGAEGRKILNVGDDNWPFPIPIIKKGSGWIFDTAAGKEEIINRRIGQNELQTIQTLLAAVDAQLEYATEDRDGNGLREYAKRFRSSRGKKDGLYWPTGAGEAQSPLGDLIARAEREGYSAKSEKAQPYWGYMYRMLTAQGKSASGGAYDYLVKGKLIGGFAIIATPVEYRQSGVMTFIVNHDGVVFQKNLGSDTAQKAAEIKTFNPDNNWTEAARTKPK